MKRSWVLAADGGGERKGSQGGAGSSGSSKRSNMVSSSSPAALTPLDERDARSINDYIEKMSHIKGQTEELNTDVRMKPQQMRKRTI